MILFLGMAGSGKSVQGKILADKLGLPWLSTGEFLRMLLSGEERRQLVTGKLIPDVEIIKLVQKIFHLIDTDKEFILDGFPRSERQVDWLLSQVDHGQLKVSAVVHLQVDEGVVLKRLQKRGRQDDHEQAVQERLNEYKNVIKPMINKLKAGNVAVLDIDGQRDIDAVHQEILKSVKSHL